MFLDNQSHQSKAIQKRGST